MSKNSNSALSKSALKFKRAQISAAKKLTKKAEKYREEGEDEKSRELLEEAQVLDPHNDDAAWWLGDYWHTEGSIQKALKQFRQYLRLRPGDPEALHMISALGGRPKPKRASNGYVRDHFDAFAEHFDESLVDDLKYQVPKLLYKTAKKFIVNGNAYSSMLDLGVGTGLVGLTFKPSVKNIWGVDLSTEMARKARKRGVYKAVAVAEITKYLKKNKRKYDIVTAADVLIYFGDVSSIFKGVGNILNDEGIFVLSAESKKNGTYKLTKSGRYSHSLAYLEQEGINAGLKVLSHRVKRLRFELGKPVMGHIMLFSKK